MKKEEVKKYIDEERVVQLKKSSKFFWDIFHLNKSIKKAVIENNQYSVGIRLNKLNMLVKNMHKFIISHGETNKEIIDDMSESLNDLIYKDKF